METVECHSGFTYAEYPLALVWGGQRLEVISCLGAWHAPGERGFKVRTRDLRLFELTYSEAGDDWHILLLEEQ